MIPPRQYVRLIAGHFQANAAGAGSASWVYGDGYKVESVDYAVQKGQEESIENWLWRRGSAYTDPTYILLNYARNAGNYDYRWGQKMGGGASAVEVRWNPSPGAKHGDFTWWIFVSDIEANLLNVEKFGNFKFPWITGSPPAPPDHPAFDPSSINYIKGPLVHP